MQIKTRLGKIRIDIDVANTGVAAFNIAVRRDERACTCDIELSACRLGVTPNDVVSRIDRRGKCGEHSATFPASA